MALADFEAGQCSRHGGPLSECVDEDADWFPQLSICHPTRQLAAAQALFDQIHKDAPYTDGDDNWSKERTADHPYHYRDGVTIWVSKVDHGLGGEFLGRSVPE